MVSNFVLAWRCERGFSDYPKSFKKRIIHKHRVVSLRFSIIYFMFINKYIPCDFNYLSLTPSSLNLVGFCYSFPHWARGFTYSLISSLFRLSADHLSRDVVVTRSTASLLGDCRHSIHHTVLLILCFISSSIHCIFMFYYDHSVCIIIFMPRNSCWVEGYYSLFSINYFDDLDTGYPVMGFMLIYFINCILLTGGLGPIYKRNFIEFSVDFRELDYFRNYVW